MENLPNKVIFSLLNPKYVGPHIDVEKDHFEQVILNLNCHFYKSKCPILALTEKASLASLFNEKWLHKNICSFQKILQLPRDHEYAEITNKLIDAFSTRHMEEWSLLYLELYFSQCCRGREYFHKMFKDGLFQENASIFFCHTERFLDDRRQFPDTHVQSKMEHLFQNLEMSQISSRKSLVSFIENHDVALKANLVDDCYFYLHKNLQKMKKDKNWNGKWYIFDVRLFIEDLTLEYEKQTNLTLKDLTKSKQIKHADFLFVCLLQDLCTGKLQNWSKIAEIDFAKHIELFTKFRNT